MPALDKPRRAHMLPFDRYLVEEPDCYFKPGQMIYSVQPLSYAGSFEGILTFSQGRDTDHVDGGLLITDHRPKGDCSYIITPKPRLIMALLLNKLFPYWRTTKPPIFYGEDVSIGENTTIGHSGFGWELHEGQWVPFPQLGEVYIGSNTTVAANCTIARGALGPTVLGNDCHLDDHVHIGHGVHLGDHVIIAANAMLSGSVVVEDNVWIGPSASIMQGVRIGKGATIGIGAVVLRDVLPGETIVGHHRVIPTKETQLGVTRPSTPPYNDI